MVLESSATSTGVWRALAKGAPQTLGYSGDRSAVSLRSQLAEAAPGELLYSTHSESWRPTTHEAAERLVSTRTWDDPWVTIARLTNGFHESDGHHHVYFQVLGVGSHALLVEGGGLDAEGWWGWTSTYLPDSIWPALVGPIWFQYLVQETEIQTDSDALAQMWTALHGEGPTEQSPPGYWWRGRHRDDLPVHAAATAP